METRETSVGWATDSTADEKADEGSMICNANQRKGTCSTTKLNASTLPSNKVWRNTPTTKGKLRWPNACEVIPLVPMRRNPNSQYITLNIMLPTETAAMNRAEPMWPTMARSTSPNSGTVMF